MAGRPGGRRTRTPGNIAKFVTQGAEQVATEISAHQAQVVERPVSKQIYEAPVTDPWDVLRRNLPPEALAALEQVTGKPAPGPGNAPWYECWDVAEGRPTGHPNFQGITKPGQHVYCPVCQRKTVMPLENYVPA